MVIHTVYKFLGSRLEHVNELTFPTPMEPIHEHDLVEDLSNGCEAKESVIALESCKKVKKSKSSNNNNNNVNLSIYFCILCDMFMHKSCIESHVSDKRHISYALKIFDKDELAISIIHLKWERKTLQPLYLNSRKLDGTIWPESVETTAEYYCDTCNKLIEKNDIVNHEMTVHKNDISLQYIDYINEQTSKINNNINIFDSYVVFKCSFCNELIHGTSALHTHFSKCEHEKNMVKNMELLRKIKEQKDGENIQNYFEPFEFLSLISFKNDGKTVQPMEQPVIYIKNCLCKNFHKNSLQNLSKMKFTYICIACKETFRLTKDIIKHLSLKEKHTKHYKNIFLIYNFEHLDIHSESVLKELSVNETQIMRPSVCIRNASIDTIKEHKAQAIQYIDNKDSLISATSTRNKDDIVHQNETNTSSLFMSPDIAREINNLIKNPENRMQIKQTKNSRSILDRYNRIYLKKYLDLEEIIFTPNQKKLETIKSNLRFYVTMERSNGTMHCILCNITHSHDIHALFEHICCEQHVTPQLNANSEQIKLAKELIRIEFIKTKCYACNEEWLHCDASRKNHSYFPSHKKKRKILLQRTENILKEFKTLWYNIQLFACAYCKIRFKTKIDFMEHLSEIHEAVLGTEDNSMFDFCVTCAALWYNGQRFSLNVTAETYPIHCAQPMHQYLEKNNGFAIPSLPQTLKKLVEDIDGIVDQLFKLSNDMLAKEKSIRLINALKYTFETCHFPVEVCMFGSRFTGLALPNSDIDVCLNFGDDCSEENVIRDRSQQIQDCLQTDSKNWEIKLILESSRTPIIKIRHRLTGLDCDISFTNRLSLENSKLIKSFNTAYPPCQKLILFLKKWLSIGGLASPKGITSYALTWLVIFYLQVKYKVPSIAALIKKHNQSKIISGWETGIGDTIPIDISERMHELLLGFFKYYGSFNYMHDIVCPLLGETCHKELFTEGYTLPLPIAMAPYTAKLLRAKPEYFRVDSSMCVQDPFDLSHNLTKAVPILTLKHFKQYCNESASILCNNIASSLKNKQK